MPLATLRSRLDYMRAQAGEERTARMHKVLQPQVSVADTRELAEKRGPLDEILRASEGPRFYELPDTGAPTTVADVEGLVACGTADDLSEQLARIAAHGIDEVILDLRLQFEEYDETVELLGREVLPALGDLVDDR